MHPIDKILAKRQAYDAIFDVSHLISTDDTNVKWSKPELYLCYWMWLDRWVNNGGCDGFLGMGVGAYTHETLTMLREIGANAHAEHLQTIVELFPDASVPKDNRTRYAIMKQIDKSKWEAAEHDASVHFFNSMDEFALLMTAYIRAHKNEFTIRKPPLQTVR